MNSSWRRRVSNLACLAALLVAALFPVRPAAAVVASEALLGGKHWRFETTKNGPVHVWTSPGYDAATAITIVHVHGDAEQRTGSNCTPSRVSYVTPYTPGKYNDAAWVKMQLPEQVLASGLNAMFIFPDGPTNGTERDAHTRVWKSLDDLLTAVKTNTGQQTPDKVIVSGHSGAYETMHHWTGNARIAAFILLDSTYDGASTYWGWYNGKATRRLAVVHTGSYGPPSKTGIQAEKIGQNVTGGAVKLGEIPDSSSELFELTGDKRVVIMKSQYCHADIVRLGKVIPVLLQWAASTSTGGSAKSPVQTTTTTTTGGGEAPPDKNYGGPTLEIPIPNLEFSDAIRQNGEITIPWLAQYIGGVYTFLISIAGLIAAVMMVIGGFQYMTAAGDQGKIGAGKKRIVDAMTGLLLALGSYTILYSINPDLVKFEGLKVSSIKTELQGEETADIDGSLTNAETTTPLDLGQQPANCPQGSKPVSPCYQNMAKCKQMCGMAGCKSSCAAAIKWYYDNNIDIEKGGKLDGKSYGPLRGENCDTECPSKSEWKKLEPICGMAQTTVNLSKALAGVPGLKMSGSETAAAPVVEGLKKLGPKAEAEGYTIQINDAYRPFQDQMSKACNKIIGAEAIEKVATSGTYDGAFNARLMKRAAQSYHELGPLLAWPGGSPHGTGIAIDISLMKGGKEIGGKGQGKANNFLRDKFMTEGTGWVKYGNECWHYDYGAKVGVNSRCLWPECPWPTEFCTNP